MSEESKKEAPKKAEPKAERDLRAELAAATRSDGILAINPKGGLVRLRPGAVTLKADPDKGPYLDGLKDGWRLATDADTKDKAAAAKAAPARPEGPSPKKSGA